MTCYDRLGENWGQNDPEVTLDEGSLTDAEQASLERLDKKDRRIRYGKNAPTLSQCLQDHAERDNAILGYRQPKNSFEEKVDWNVPKQINEMTERDALVELDLFLARVLKRAIEVEHETDLEETDRKQAREMKGLVERFREKLAFIGEKELQEACAGIARELVQVARSGKEVFLYSYQKERSPGYMEVRVMQEVERQLSGDEQKLRRFHFGGTEEEIAAHCERAAGAYHIATMDDFVVSGTKMSAGFRPAHTLIAKGVDATEVMDRTCAYVVAAPKRKEWDAEIPISGYDDTSEFEPHFYSHFRVSVQDTSVHEMSMTGAHSYTDYGFQTTLDQMLAFYRQHDRRAYFPREQKWVAGSPLALPRLYRFYKPYEEVMAQERSPISAESVEASDLQKGRVKALEAERQRLTRQYPVT